MEIQLQELIEKIKKDGVEVAEGEAESIINTAKAEAEKIISDAEKQNEELKSRCQPDYKKLQQLHAAAKTIGNPEKQE